MEISIITPSLNQGEFIEETIKSVINQSGDFDLEYIIMDGGSTDGTLNIIKKYDVLINSGGFNAKCKKLTFKWFSEKDRGQSHAVNKGLKMAAGEVVNWIPSDDMLAEGALQEIAGFFSRHKDAKVVFGNAIRLDEKGVESEVLKGREFTEEELIRRWDRANQIFSIEQPSTFFRKSLIEEVGYLDERYHLAMHYDLPLKVRKRYPFHYIDVTLSRTRLHPECKSVKFRVEQFNEAIEISRQHWYENYPKYFFSYYFFLLIRRPIGEFLKKIGMYDFVISVLPQR